MKRAVVTALGIVIIAGLAVLSFAAGGGKQPGSTSPEAFDLPALQGGGRVRLASFRGRPVVVALFASWCTPCRTELPAYAAAARRLRGRVQFIGVDAQENGDGAGFARQFDLAGSGFALAKDIGESSSGGLYKAYGAHGLPLTAFYSPSGSVLWKANAALGPDVLASELAKLYGVS
jgi:thiol-disulfide isomerase/thioredoxin